MSNRRIESVFLTQRVKSDGKNDGTASRQTILNIGTIKSDKKELTAYLARAPLPRTFSISKDARWRFSFVCFVMGAVFFFSPRMRRTIGSICTEIFAVSLVYF